jgi:hypothetical protein
MWDLCRSKWHYGSFFHSSSVSPANSHFTECSILVYHPGLVLVARLPIGLSLIPPHEIKTAVKIAYPIGLTFDQASSRGPWINVERSMLFSILEGWLQTQFVDIFSDLCVCKL